MPEDRSGGFVMDNILKALGLDPADLEKIKAVLNLFEVVKSGDKTTIKFKDSGVDVTLNKR